MKKIVTFLIFSVILYSFLFAAVGCDLNDPDRDVKRFFSDSTGYKTAYLSLEKLGGSELLKEVEQKLGDNFQGLYETPDVPYTVYTIYKNSDIIGYIHGINQKGQYGGIQVFLVYDLKGNIINFYYQKLTSKKAKDLRATSFSNQFIGLNLKDFENYDPKTGKTDNKKIIEIKNPNPDNNIDFLATIRAVKKNLILMDIFVFNKNK
ncbi:MAG: hypothetical protein LBF97_07355 [Elusimicrobiota bacterium]|jgi:hypothetical protein|nr:hypothetical protein [Elusimicrobiota bacterium]